MALSSVENIVDAIAFLALNLLKKTKYVVIMPIPPALRLFRGPVRTTLAAPQNLQNTLKKQWFLKVSVGRPTTILDLKMA